MTIVVIGSSGGGTATLGHTNAVQLLTTIHKELKKIRTLPLVPVPCDNDRDDDDDDDKSESLEKISHGIRFALFVSLHGGKGLDSADPMKDRATLWTVGIEDDDDDNDTTDAHTKSSMSSLSRTFQVKATYTGILHDVNIKAKALEEQIIVPYVTTARTNNNHNKASKNHQGIRGIICISCDPGNVNYASLHAAASFNIPITGSGGTSLSAALATHQGLQLVGNAGGSVATTTYTRAVSYVYALASYWDMSYSPFFTVAQRCNDGSCAVNEVDVDDDDISKPHLRSVLDSCLPSFLGVCLACHLLELIQYVTSMIPKENGIFQFIFLSNENDYNDWIDIDMLYSQLRYQVLPSVCAVVTATSYAPEHGSTAIMAATIASFGCYKSVLSGLFAGWLVSQMLGRVLFACIKRNVPATMTNILLGGCIGSTIAIFLRITCINSLLGWITQSIRLIVRCQYSCLYLYLPFSSSLSSFSGFGFFVGCVFCYGSKVGWYHSIFLPIILIEMEHGEASILGAVDECTLVIVSAGICTANLFTSKYFSSSSSLTSNSKELGNISVCKRGLLINLLCGDFIEVAYPFMEKSHVVNIACYIASGISTEILNHSNCDEVLSSAYLPVFLSIMLAKDWVRMGFAVLTSFLISFCGMMIHNLFLEKKNNNSEGNTGNCPSESKGDTKMKKI
mmetsp:Transcript_6101/g.7744  ORF Transcript_6101/g.7744 Transcript_6101/m.7744 type:complete len:678 (+) Transcript_6101:114-2147(+)